MAQQQQQQQTPDFVFQEVTQDEIDAARKQAEHQHIAQISSDLLEVQELQQQLNDLVTDQQPQIDDIKKNVDDASDNVQAGKKNIEKAAEYQPKILGKPLIGKLNFWQKIDQRLTMPGLLKQARKSFNQWLELNNYFLKEKPSFKVYGIIFLSTVAGGFGIGAEGKSGVVIFRDNLKNLGEKDSDHDQDSKDDAIDSGDSKQNDNNNDNGNSNDKNKNDNNNNDKNNSEWSHPCALAGGGVSGGLQIGVSKIDQIIIMTHSRHVKTFLGHLTFQLGASAETAFGGKGGNKSGSLNLSDKHLSEMVCCTLNTKGFLAGVKVSLSGIAVNYDVNKKYYKNKKVSITKIYQQTVNEPPEVNEDYSAMVGQMSKYFANSNKGGHSKVAKQKTDSGQGQEQGGNKRPKLICRMKSVK